MQPEASHPERDKAWSMPLEQIDPSKGYLFEHDYVGWYFERLRRDDPVHLSHSKRFGPYWSVTKYKDIMAVDTNHATYSSDAHLGGISHPRRRRRGLPAPASSRWTRRATTSSARRREPDRCARQPGELLEGIIRERAARILDGLPIGEEFDWVDARLHRADHADARHPVRLPLRGPAPAHLVVRHGHRRPRRQRPGHVVGAAQAELGELRTTSPGSGISAGMPRRATT
jgi:hypothetical protein